MNIAIAVIITLLAFTAGFMVAALCAAARRGDDISRRLDDEHRDAA